MKFQSGPRAQRARFVDGRVGASWQRLSRKPPTGRAWNAKSDYLQLPKYELACPVVRYSVWMNRMLACEALAI